MTWRWLTRYLLGLAVLFSLTMLYVNSLYINPQQHDDIINDFRSLKQLSTRLNLQLLKVRYRLVQNYDELVIKLAAIEQTYKHLAETLQQSRLSNDAVSRQLEMLENNYSRQRNMLEKFKSTNAVLNNSLRYLPTAAQELVARIPPLKKNFSLVYKIHKLERQALNYVLTGNNESRMQGQVLISRLADRHTGKAGLDDDIENFLQHLRLVFTQKPVVDEALNELLNLPTATLINGLYSTYTEQYQQASKQADTYRLILYLASVILLVDSVWVLFNFTRTARKLKSTVQELHYQKKALDQHAIVTITDKDGNITYVNEKFCQISKYNNTELLGKNHRILNSGVHPPAFFKNMWQTISHGEVWHGIICNRNKHGEYYWVDTTIVPFVDESGEPYKYVAVRTDISQLKRVQEELIQYRNELEVRVAERTVTLEEAVRELEAFSYSISHDLRSPLRAIDGYSHILAEDHADKLDSEAREYLKRIRHNAQFMGALIDNLLRLTRIGRMKLQRSRVNPGKLCLQLMDKHLSANPQQKIEFICHPVPDIEADPEQLQLVLDNLLGNAIKFSDKQHPRIEFGLDDSCQPPAFYLRDNGVGFNMAYYGKLFGIFQRLHRVDEYDGAGVGLALVERIIRKHGGKIWAQSQEGKGATFYFTFSESAGVSRTDANKMLKTAPDKTIPDKIS